MSSCDFVFWDLNRTCTGFGFCVSNEVMTTFCGNYMLCTQFPVPHPRISSSPYTLLFDREVNVVHFDVTVLYSVWPNTTQTLNDPSWCLPCSLDCRLHPTVTTNLSTRGDTPHSLTRSFFPLFSTDLLVHLLLLPIVLLFFVGLVVLLFLLVSRLDKIGSFSV